MLKVFNIDFEGTIFPDLHHYSHWQNPQAQLSLLLCHCKLLVMDMAGMATSCAVALNSKVTLQQEE